MQIKQRLRLKFLVIIGREEVFLEPMLQVLDVLLYRLPVVSFYPPQNASEKTQKTESLRNFRKCQGYFYDKDPGALSTAEVNSSKALVRGLG